MDMEGSEHPAVMQHTDEEMQFYEMHDMTSTDHINKSTEESNELSRELRPMDSRSIWEKIWYGPLNPEDKPPRFFLRWKTLKYIDELPGRFNDSVIGSSTLLRYGALTVYTTIWMLIVSAILFPYLLVPPKFEPNNDSSAVTIIPLTCTQSLKDWKGDNNACGLNAELCNINSQKDVFVRCPAFCDRAWIYSAQTVGDHRVKYTEYNIGGGPIKHGDKRSLPYRGDSAVCSSAYHSKLISGFSGGCVKVSKSGAHSSFPSEKGKSGWSVPFDSFFPASFSFTEIRDGITSGCYDPRCLIMILNILFSLPIFYLYESIIGYWTITIAGFWTLLLIFDPPILTDPSKPSTVAELISIGFERLLPLCFILYVIWRAAVKRTLQDGSPLVKITLWFPTFWLGVMNNVTFDRLPVDRLTLKDLKELAGALIAVGSIITTILICAVIQAYSIWKSGRFAKYFKCLVAVVAGIYVLTLLPGLTLRIHHYILGMTLVMFCSSRGASAYLFQGILIGLVISGVGTWGFASIVETNISLLRGEAGASFVPPVFVFNNSEPHIVSWHPRNASHVPPKMDGYSLLINDVERYVGNATHLDLDWLITENQSFGELLNNSITNSENHSLPLYLRIAHTSTKNPTKDVGDYTNAAILQWPEGVWQDPPPGVS